MGRFPGRFRERQRDDALGRLDAQRLDARGTRLVAEQPIEALLDKALRPAPNTGLGLASSPHNLIRADTIGGQQHDLRPPDVFLRRVASFSGLEPGLRADDEYWPTKRRAIFQPRIVQRSHDAPGS